MQRRLLRLTVTVTLCVLCHVNSRYVLTSDITRNHFADYYRAAGVQPFMTHVDAYTQSVDMNYQTNNAS